MAERRFCTAGGAPRETSAQVSLASAYRKERRPQGIGEGNLSIDRAMLWDRVEAAANQAKERIGGEMLAFFGGNNRHGKLHHQNIHVFQ